jgi:hypothetical protein
MMTYRHWKWSDDATEEQIESKTNEAAVERLAAEARQLYDSIPQPRRYDDEDRGDDGQFDDMTDEEYAAWKQRRADEITAAWGQIEAIVELMSARGAVFARDYEHWNEDERLVEYLENKYDSEY